MPCLLLAETLTRASHCLLNSSSAAHLQGTTGRLPDCREPSRGEPSRGKHTKPQRRVQKEIAQLVTKNCRIQTSKSSLPFLSPSFAKQSGTSTPVSGAISTPPSRPAPTLDVRRPNAFRNPRRCGPSGEPRRVAPQCPREGCEPRRTAPSPCGSGLPGGRRPAWKIDPFPSLLQARLPSPQTPSGSWPEGPISCGETRPARS